MDQPYHNGPRVAGASMDGAMHQLVPREMLNHTPPPQTTTSTTAITAVNKKSVQTWYQDDPKIIFKKTLEGFIDKRVLDFHDHLHGTVPQPYSMNGTSAQQHSENQLSQVLQICRSCTYTDIQRHNSTWTVSCPSNVCSTWIRHILMYHADDKSPKIERSSLQPQRWPFYPWEVAKIFLPYHCGNIAAARDADVTTLLTLLKNCKFMRDCLENPKLVEEVLDECREPVDSKEECVIDNDSQRQTGKMIELLRSLKGLTDTEKSRIYIAILEIKQLIGDDRQDKKKRKKKMSPSHASAKKKMKSGPAMKEGRPFGDVEKEDLTNAFEDRTSETIIQEAKVFICTETLKSSYTFLVAKLRPENIIDSFVGQNIFCSETRVRDIRELPKTSDKSRHITDMVLRNSELYPKFKIALGDAEQESIIAKLEEEERNAHEQFLVKKRCVCKSTETCPVLQNLTLGTDRQTNKKTHITKDYEGIQKSLIKGYRKKWLYVRNPAKKKDDVGLEHVHVDGTARVVQESEGRGGLRNVNKMVGRMSLKEMLYTGSDCCTQIYITGDPETGKSMFCRNIVKLWCEAHGSVFDELGDSESDSKYNGNQEEEDKKILSSFPLLFIISPNDSPSNCSIAEMIDSQILCFDSFKGVTASELLTNVCCLVILDGLDNWVHPEGSNPGQLVNPRIPDRDIYNQKTVFVTAIRSEEFRKLELKSSEVDKQIEVCGLNEQCSSLLFSKVLKLYYKGCHDSERQPYSDMEKEYFEMTGRVHISTINPKTYTESITDWLEEKKTNQ